MLATWSPLTPSRSLQDIRFVQAAVKESRTLVFSPSADALHAQLIQYARTNRLPYLRVTLREQADLDRLMIQVKIEDGKIEATQGPLAELIQSGGVLLLDYTGSNPKLVEGFNSLFDRSPYFEGISASPDLRVIGVMKEENFSDHPVSFYSRYHKVISYQPDRFKDPADGVTAPPAGTDAVKADLFESPDYRDLLLGRFYLSPKGIPSVQEGKLIEAIRQGKSLVLRGADWSAASPLKDFIRQILIQGEVEFNGVIYKIPKIYREEVDFSRGVEKKSILLPEESKLAGPLWIVNEENQDLLFTRTRVAGKKLTQQEGILPQKPGATARLKITAPLAPWVWHRILHAPGEVEILVEDPAFVPALYRGLLSKKCAEAAQRRAAHSLEEMRSKKGIYLVGEDLDLLRSQLQNEFPEEELVVYPVTPETTLQDLLESIQIAAAVDKKTGEKKREFKMEKLGILLALQRGHRILLEGLHHNPALMKELEPLFADDPYLILNGERVSLGKLSGQVWAIGKPSPQAAARFDHLVEMKMTDEALFAALLRDFPMMSEQVFEKIKKIREVFKTIPSPGASRRTPEQAPFNFYRIKMLLQFDNWPEAFENVFIESYKEDPEKAAFMRVMVRLIFEQDEMGRRPNTIHGKKLRQVINKVVPPIAMETHFWQFADTLSLDLLQKTVKETKYDIGEKGEVLRLIEDAFLFNAKGEKREFYAAKFHREAPREAPQIDEETQAGEETFDARKERVKRMLILFRAVMLKGSPGVGKSYLSQQLPAEMGYRKDDKDENKNEVIGPITVGEDIQEPQVVGRRVVDKAGSTGLFDEAVGKWSSKKKGAILIVDEANLPPEAYWSFLTGLFAPKPYVWVHGKRRFLTPRHRVIFTGNQEWQAGRKFQELVEKYMVTVNFPEFDPAFLRAQVRDYLFDDKKEKEKLIGLYTAH